MKRQISLAHLTALDLPPPKLIEAAAKAGFDAVGLRLIRVTDTTPGYPLMRDTKMMTETKAALQDTGLSVSDIEFVKIETQTDLPALFPFLDAGAELGAREVICAPYDPDLNRLSDNVGTLSELAKSRGLGVSLEFFPWTVVPDLASAHRIVENAGPDVGILVDTLHFDRSDSSLLELQELSGHRMRLAHLCDAPVQQSYTTDELLFTARAERLPPGEGQIDLVPILAALPKSLPIGLEVPMVSRIAEVGHDVFLKHLIAVTRTLLAETQTETAQAE